MITLLKTAKKERSAAYKAMKSDAGKGIATGAISGGILGGIAARDEDDITIMDGASYNSGYRAASGGAYGGLDGYIGQKVLGGEFDDSYKGSLKRNIVGSGIRGTVQGAGEAIIHRNPLRLTKGLTSAAWGAGKGTAGKFVKDKSLGAARAIDNKLSKKNRG